MASTRYIIATILIVAVTVSSAPSEEVKPTVETITQVSRHDVPDQATLTRVDANENQEKAPKQTRQKRWYNDYGFPPVNPYSNIFKRENPFDTAFPGFDEPFSQFFSNFRRFQQASGFGRQPQFQQPQFPFFFPVFYVPYPCKCTNGDSNVTVENRFPQMDDPRQNWGFADNVSRPARPAISLDDDYVDDSVRPISFDPIRPSRPPVSVPSVDRGSTQAGGAVTSRPTGQNRPVPGSGQSGASPAPSRPRPRPPPPPTTLPPPTQSAEPTACDGASIICCHQPQITMDCFVSKGCANPAANGNPCDLNVILPAIEKFLKIYGLRT